MCCCVVGDVVMAVVVLLGGGGGHVLLRVGACWHGDGRRCWRHGAGGVAMALVLLRHGVGSDTSDTALVALLLFTGVVVQQPGWLFPFVQARL
jgi:hypothetical protein